MEDGDAMTAALRVRGLCLARGSRTILAGVDLDAAAGEVVALMGLSGSGKTTILRVLAGLEAPDAGDVVVPPVGMVFQFHFLFEHLTALENVTLAPVHARRVPRAEAEARATRLLAEMGVGHRAGRCPASCRGRAQRVAIARALAVDPPVLLLDEPTASLDPARRNDLGEVLRGLAGTGRTLLITSHDDDFVRDYSTRVVVLANGRVVEEGIPARVLADPAHEETRRLLQVERERKRG